MSSMTHDAELARLAPLGDAVRASRIDGVPVVHAERTGIMRASLLFRVGGADEPLPLRGITHLIEHLALHRLDSLAHDRNGNVQSSTTEFTVAGSEEQVVDFLNGVCAALRELPLSRLDAEKSVLRTEGQSRSGMAEDSLLRARFGARGPARMSYEENALEWVDADQVRAWVNRWFVTGNAVLWLSSAEVPEGLDLRLPEGERIPRETVMPITRPRPLSVQGPPRVVMADALVPRSTAARLAAELLRVVLFRELRLEGGLSYTAHANYEPLDADTARLLVLADATDQQQGAVIGATVDALAGLRAGRIDERDVATARGALLDGLTQWDEAGAGAIMATGMLILDEEIRASDTVRADIESVTVEELHEVILAFWADSIWLTPGGPLDWIGATEISYAQPPIQGHWFEYQASRERLVVGGDGVSWVAPDHALTVRAEDCALLLAAGDGGRLFIGRDAVSVTIEPTLIRGFGEEQIAALDALVPAEKRVPVAARTPDQLPSPPVAERPARRPAWRLWLLLIGVIAASFVLAVLAFVVPGASIVLGLALGSVVLIVQRMSARRTQQRQEDVLTDSGSSPDSGSEAISFTVAPTRTLADSVAEVKTLLSATSPGEPLTRSSRPVVVVDRHVVTICDDSGRRFFAVPSSHVVGVTAGTVRMTSPTGLPMKAAAMTMVVRVDDAERELVFAPFPGFMRRTQLSEAEDLAVLVRGVLGHSGAADSRSSDLSVSAR